MQSSSADTTSRLVNNVVAVAESGNQSSPATGDSGAASGTWQNVPSRRSKSSASNRSMGRTSARSTPHAGHRTPRRTTTRSGTPRSHQDRSPRTRDTPGKRKTDGPEYFSLDQAAREELLEFQGECHEELLSNQMLGDRVRMLESEVVSRNRVIGDIEVKFTDYLRGYYHTVNSEVETLNEMLTRSATEVREYQAELMVAAQDEIGSTMRIEELERRTNLAENVAQRINDKGMIMREEYQDQVQHLHGLLLHTEDRVRQMESDSEYAQSVANRPHSEGTEMQLSMQHAIMSFKQQSDLDTTNNTDLQLINTKAYDELTEYNNEIESLRQQLTVAYNENKTSEETVRKVVHECRLKVSEANTQRIVSEHKLRVLRNEATLRREREKETEARNMSDNMIKDQQISDMRGEIIALESRLKELDVAMAGAITTSSGMVHHPMFEQLESELKIQQITNGDLVEEAHEYVKENIRLKDEVSTLSSKTALVSSGADLDKFKSELVAERKSHLVALNEKDIKIWSSEGSGREKISIKWERWGNIFFESTFTDHAI